LLEEAEEEDLILVVLQLLQEEEEGLVDIDLGPFLNFPLDHMTFKWVVEELVVDQEQ